MPYVEFQKGSKKRRVFAPSKRWKSYLRSLAPSLHVLQEVACDHEAESGGACDIVHGFMYGKSALTNARRHAGDYDVTISMDLKDFFPSVTFKKIRDSWRYLYGEKAEIPGVLMQRLYIDKRTGKPVSGKVMKTAVAGEMDDEVADLLIAEQGLPTSPMLANIAAAKMDWKMLEHTGAFDIYTRYADDMTFSITGIADGNHANAAIEMFKEISVSCGFTINDKKTKVQHARAGRRIITGYSVGEVDVRATRKVRRKLRAAKHNGWTRKEAGITEFCRLAMPNSENKIANAPYDMAVKLLRWGVPADVVLGRFEQMKRMVENTMETVTANLNACLRHKEEVRAESLERHEFSMNKWKRHLSAIESAIAVCVVAKNS